MLLDDEDAIDAIARAVQYAIKQPGAVDKKNADEHLSASGPHYTVVRPGKLTEDRGSARVQAAERLDEFGEIARESVAAALLARLDADNTVGKTYDLLTSDTPIAETLAGLRSPLKPS